MNIFHNFSRRTILKSGMATLACTAASADNVLASWKAPGETRVIIHGGDFYHNGVMQEQSWRRVLGPTNWRLLFAQDSDFITPEVLEKADLFILCRYATDTQETNFSLGFSPDSFVEDRPIPSVFMTDEQENTIVENVRRGMGLLAIHCSIWNPDSKKFLSLLGAEKSIMHTKVQPAYINNLNRNHPITKGIEPFNIGDDEIFNAEMKPGQYELLFNTRGEEQPINAFGGWCREESNGRVVALLPGHLPGPYMQKPYRVIMWRSAHWALKKDIPPCDHIRERYDS